jgi:hypothetical protein
VRRTGRLFGLRVGVTGYEKKWLWEVVIIIGFGLVGMQSVSIPTIVITVSFHHAFLDILETMQLTTAVCHRLLQAYRRPDHGDFDSSEEYVRSKSAIHGIGRWRADPL